MAQGSRILLAAQGMDPDVFVWDTAQRLVNYSNGAYIVESVLKHSTLAPAGTQAVILSCRRFRVGVRPASAFTEIMKVRIFIQAGRPHAGWISAEDARWPNGKPILPVSP